MYGVTNLDDQEEDIFMEEKLDLPFENAKRRNSKEFVSAFAKKKELSKIV